MVNIRKRGKVYQYQFEIAKVDGKRKYISKSGFKTRKEANNILEKIIQTDVINEIMNYKFWQIFIKILNVEE